MKKKIAREYKSGDTIALIAFRHRISATTVRKVLGELKVPTRSAQSWAKKK